jgi:mycofactocin precursor peptide peptidase
MDDLSTLTWRTVPHDLVLVPIGSLEQHGPHLPLGTDTTVAVAVARRLHALAVEGGIAASVAPAMPYGASGEHEGFDGTVSIGTETLALVLVELGRSASRWAARIVFVNGHGGNLDALGRAVPLLRTEGRDASWIACAPGPDAPEPDPHAGRHETALMLHLSPDAVRIEDAEPGDIRPLAETLPLLRAHGVAGVAPNGVLGDPAGATAAQGSELLDSICARAWRALSGDGVAADGRRTGGDT